MMRCMVRKLKAIFKEWTYFFRCVYKAKVLHIETWQKVTPNNIKIKQLQQNNLNNEM